MYATQEDTLGTRSLQTARQLQPRSSGMLQVPHCAFDFVVKGP